MKKKNLGLNFSYHIDEKNRCVICWLDYRYGDLNKILEAPIQKYTGFDFYSALFIKEFFPPDGKIKTIAKAHSDDVWDPEGLKKLARMKAERSFYKRMSTAIQKLRCDLLMAQSELVDVEYCFSKWFELVNQKITDPKFYQNWRTKKAE